MFRYLLQLISLVVHTMRIKLLLVKKGTIYSKLRDTYENYHYADNKTIWKFVIALVFTGLCCFISMVEEYIFDIQFIDNWYNSPYAELSAFLYTSLVGCIQLFMIVHSFPCHLSSHFMLNDLLLWAWFGYRIRYLK